jgi:hypothetical protein
MSNALAISAVTAVLQYYLNNMYSTAQGFPSQVTVSCLAPDQVTTGHGGPSDVENQVNLFMHQVTHNAAWRNADLASMSADGTRRLSSPPLALNLHYLLTAYGSDYWQAEALLGYALMMLHEAPVLTREDIANAMTMLTNPPPPTPLPFPSNSLTNYLPTSGIGDQIEMIKITPETLGREEMAWLWTALKADYRPTFPFQVSVVLMEPALPTTLALPVLSRVFGTQAMNAAQISEVVPRLNHTVALPGETVTINGAFLTGASQVAVINSRLGVTLTPPPPVVTSDAESVTFALPADTAGTYPAGVYDLTVQFLDPTGTFVSQASNTLPVAIACTLPAQTALTAPATMPNGAAGVMVTVQNISPPVWEGQDVTLALSTLVAPLISKSAPVQPFTGPQTTLSFLFEAGTASDPGLPTGQPLLGRLLVDNVTSLVSADVSVFPPFLAPLVTL